MFRREPRIDLREARIPIDGERGPERGAVDRDDDAGVRIAGRLRRHAAHDAVVALVDRRARADVEMREDSLERLGIRNRIELRPQLRGPRVRGIRGRGIGRGRCSRGIRPLRRGLVRAVVADPGQEKIDRDAQHFFAAEAQHVIALGRDRPDHRRACAARDLRQAELFVVDREQHRRELRRDDPRQALLRLADGDHRGRQMGLRGRAAIEIDDRAEAAAPDDLRRAARDPARAEILEADRQPARADLRERAIARAHDHVLEERIGDLHGALVRLRILVVEDERGERRAAEAAAIRRFADEHDIPAGRAFRRRRVDDVALFHEPERDDVHEAIVAEALVEIDVAADIRHADRVAVRRDPVDDALRDVARMRIVERPETERIGDRDHLRAHAQHVADDPADPGRRALEGDDLRGVVVRFVREHDAVALALPFAEMDDPRILLRPLHHGRPRRRQALEEVPRALVRAMLAPSRIEDVRLDDRRIAPEALGDAAQFVRS